MHMVSVFSVGAVAIGGEVEILSESACCFEL